MASIKLEDNMAITDFTAAGDSLVQVVGNDTVYFQTDKTEDFWLVINKEKYLEIPDGTTVSFKCQEKATLAVAAM